LFASRACIPVTFSSADAQQGYERLTAGVQARSAWLTAAPIFQLGIAQLVHCPYAMKQLLSWGQSMQVLCLNQSRAAPLTTIFWMEANELLGTVLIKCHTASRTAIFTSTMTKSLRDLRTAPQPEIYCLTPNPAAPQPELHLLTSRNYAW